MTWGGCACTYSLILSLNIVFVGLWWRSSTQVRRHQLRRRKSRWSREKWKTERVVMTSWSSGTTLPNPTTTAKASLSSSTSSLTVRLHFTQSYTQYVCTLIDTTQSAFGVVFTFTFMILFLGCCFMIFWFIQFIRNWFRIDIAMQR